MAETVGEQLKNEREARKLTLEQVYQSTRVNVRYLKALEEDRHDALPSPVQAKGFLRLYAGFLGLPAQALIDLWEGNTLPDAALEMVEDEEPDAEIESYTPEPVEDEVVPIIVALDEEAGPPEVDEAPLITPSEQIFQEIGQQLRERREALGLSLTDIEHYTKLRQHYLQALEQGRLKDLPSLVQGRGMLFNYATFLELDADSLLLRFAEALQERRVEIMPPQPAPNLFQRQKNRAAAGPLPAWRRFVTPDLLIGGGVILVILLFAIWGASQVSALRREQAARTEIPVANVLLFTETPAPPAVDSAAAPQAITVAPNSEVGNLPQQSSGETTPTALPVLDELPLQVYVIALDRAWLRVVEDGEVAFSGRVVAGNPYQFSAEEQIELSTGNAAGIRVYFNQFDMGSLGLYGQVVNLIFNTEGVLTPTPSFTETPTPTQMPTITATITPTPQATPSVTPYIP